MVTESDASEIAWAGVTIDCREPERMADFWSALLKLAAQPADPDRQGW